MESNLRKANRLIHETSPYLLQHAHNPVDWYPWCDEAFQKAIKENKPILLSIGYSTCHWCHVMERESFENPEVAKFMNDHFVCIKLDREERPDLDQIYMDAVQVMTGQGGWPLNVFLTPDKKPFFGGTYFPPVSYPGRPSWMYVLSQLYKVYTTDTKLIQQQSKELLAQMHRMDRMELAKGERPIDDDYFHKAYDTLKQSFDEQFGGYGSAPKFPSTYTTMFLLHYYYFFKSDEALQHALKTIRAMIRGGIYDQLRGGLCRYATDSAWRIPHFEKMLYDNANFLELICAIYKLTGDKELYEIIQQTSDFILSDFRAENYLFYSAYDADSDGEEGKFYCWGYDEINQIIGKDAVWFVKYYNVKPQGNWENTNILYCEKSVEEFATDYGLSQSEFHNKLRAVHKRLREEASKRTKPSLDYKQIVSWNAMMMSALLDVALVLGTPALIQSIESSFISLLEQIITDGTRLYHQISRNVAKHEALLDDYAFVVSTALKLHSLTGNISHLNTASDLTECVIQEFYDEERGLFHYAHKEKEDVIMNKYEIFDNVIASGNSIMLECLIKINYINPDERRRKIINNILQNVTDVVAQFPLSTSNWLCVALKSHKHNGELVITGTQALEKINIILQKFIPEYLILPLISYQTGHALYLDKFVNNTEFKYYLCRNHTCNLPSSDWASLQQLLNN